MSSTKGAARPIAIGHWSRTTAALRFWALRRPRLVIVNSNWMLRENPLESSQLFAASQ